MMLAPIDATDRVYTIDPSGVAVGAISANYWTGFESPAQRVFSDGGFKYLGLASGDPFIDTAFVTKAIGLDQEISLKRAQSYQDIRVYLRYDGTHAVYLTVSVNDNKFTANYVRIVGRINQYKDVGNDTFIEGAMGDNTARASLTSLIGSTFNLATDVWTFGAVGDTFYAKFNGTTFWTYRLWAHARPGKIAALIPFNDARGFRDVTCTFKPSTASFADFDNLVLDARAFGFKDSATTGSMSAGSYTLNVADASGFSVGDPIIVELGGEAGAGVTGTEGVGGTWPKESFANAAALPNPATWRAAHNNTDSFVWLRDTAEVWINYLNGVGGPATWGAFTPVTQDYYYYWNKVLPRALTANITAKSGNTLTLDKAAVVATTNANVYFDCTPAFILFQQGNAHKGTVEDWFAERAGVTWRIPPGRYAVWKFHTIPSTQSWTMRGETRDSTILYSPKGTAFLAVYHYGSDTLWSDMTFSANVGNKYFCHDTDHYYNTIKTALLLSGNTNNGRGGEFRAKVKRVDFYNCVGAVNMSAMSDGEVSDCREYMNMGNLQAYLSWSFAQQYCKRTFYYRCEYHADKLGGGFEVFQADGGGFIDCVSINGMTASNFSGGDYVWENMKISIDLNQHPEHKWFLGTIPALNINVNIGGGAEAPQVILEGGRVINPDITLIQSSIDGELPTGIVVNDDCVNIRITGTHPAKNGKGVITFVRAPGFEDQARSGINATEPVVVTGMRVKGNSTQTVHTGGYADIITHINDGSVIQNNVTDTIWAVDTATSTFYDLQNTNGNITNEAYEALP